MRLRDRAALWVSQHKGGRLFEYLIVIAAILVGAIVFFACYGKDLMLTDRIARNPYYLGAKLSDMRGGIWENVGVGYPPPQIVTSGAWDVTHGGICDINGRCCYGGMWANIVSSVSRRIPNERFLRRSSSSFLHSSTSEILDCDWGRSSARILPSCLYHPHLSLSLYETHLGLESTKNHKWALSISECAAGSIRTGLSCFRRILRGLGSFSHFAPLQFGEVNGVPEKDQREDRKQCWWSDEPPIGSSVNPKSRFRIYQLLQVAAFLIGFAGFCLIYSLPGSDVGNASKIKRLIIGIALIAVFFVLQHAALSVLNDGCAPFGVMP